jgi:hypothetical protein
MVRAEILSAFQAIDGVGGLRLQRATRKDPREIPVFPVDTGRTVSSLSTIIKCRGPDPHSHRPSRAAGGGSLVDARRQAQIGCLLRPSRQVDLAFEPPSQRFASSRSSSPGPAFPETEDLPLHSATSVARLDRPSGPRLSEAGTSAAANRRARPQGSSIVRLAQVRTNQITERRSTAC